MKETASRLWRELEPFVGPAIIVAIYASVRVIYAVASTSQGVLTPSGAVESWRAALALATVGLRIFVLTIVSGVVVYRSIMRLLRNWISD